MKNRKAQFLPAVVLFLGLPSGIGAYAQITPSADTYINTADPATNYGAATLLNVHGATEAAYIQFNLASIPPTASVSQATLKLYVNSVTTAGSFNVDYVNGSWSESTIDASNAPPPGATVVSNINVTTADKNQYILINVTPAVQAWLNGSEINNGLALVANSTFNATFDSKENTTTSHPAELDIVFAGGAGGGITGITTATGSGLSGGGTSGTLNLSLTDACASNQVLQWNGSAWVCAGLSGGGTITGVKAGTGLTGGGTSGTVTVNLDTTKVPLLAASNTFTGNQTVNGNLGATGIAAGSVNVTSAINANSVTTTASTGGVNSTMTGSGNSIAAITGSATATGAAGFTFGVIGQSASNTGRGVFGLATGNGGIGVIGENNNGPGFGVVGKALPGSTGDGVYGVQGSASSTGSDNTYLGTELAGVWGDTGTPSSEAGPYVTAVLATADDAAAGVFANNSPTGYDTLDVIAFGGSKNFPFQAANINEQGYGNWCDVDPSGNLNCTGSKNAIVPIDGGKRTVAMSAIESPSNWFEDFGSAQLINGVAVVHLDPDFIQTVNTGEDYRVFPVPNGDCKGLYVASKGPDSFEVRELGGGTSNINFDYRITAIRRNYETVRFADHTNDPDPRKMAERMRAHRTKASSVPVSVPVTEAPTSSAQAEAHN